MGAVSTVAIGTARQSAESQAESRTEHRLSGPTRCSHSSCVHGTGCCALAGGPTVGGVQHEPMRPLAKHRVRLARQDKLRRRAVHAVARADLLGAGAKNVVDCGLASGFLLPHAEDCPGRDVAWARAGGVGLEVGGLAGAGPSAEPRSRSGSRSWGRPKAARSSSRSSSRQRHRAKRP